MSVPKPIVGREREGDHERGQQGSSGKEGGDWAEDRMELLDRRGDWKIREVPLEDGGGCLGSCSVGDCFRGGRWGTMVKQK